MPPADPRPQLSAITSTLEDVTGRVTQLAKGLDSEETEIAAAALFEVERNLRAARRSLIRATRDLTH